MTNFPLLKESQAWLDTGSLPEPLPSRLAVGWSGGADSTALLLALAGAGYDVHAWHVDHAWHQSSGEQSEQLAEQAALWGIPFSSVRLETSPGSNREAVARSGRYQAFHQLSQEQGLTALCLAHHRNDQAETVFMRMLQGAGVQGIRGMHQVRLRDGLKIFRPLLHLSRSELVTSLKNAEVTWLDDISNSDMTLWRNRLRKQVFPAMEASGIDPTELFLRWQRQAVIISAEINSEIDQIHLQCDATNCSLPWREWEGLPSTMRAYLLQRMMQRLFGEGSVAGRRHILLVEQWMQQGGFGGLDLSRSRIMRKDGRLYLKRKT
ncbi:MAG: tRNA lysidine(34) synthetase TilS [Mariprofundaceae bacterium]